MFFRFIPFCFLLCLFTLHFFLSNLIIELGDSSSEFSHNFPWFCWPLSYWIVFLLFCCLVQGRVVLLVFKLFYRIRNQNFLYINFMVPLFCHCQIIAAVLRNFIQGPDGFTADLSVLTLIFMFFCLKSLIMNFIEFILLIFIFLKTHIFFSTFLSFTSGYRSHRFFSNWMDYWERFVHDIVFLVASDDMGEIGNLGIDIFSHNIYGLQMIQFWQFIGISFLFIPIFLTNCIFQGIITLYHWFNEPQLCG